MASRPKAPMPVIERAKQFLPFSALKGLEEALERKENDVTVKENRPTRSTDGE